MISMIVALTNSGVIGKDGELPWHIPLDLKHFKEVTINKTIVMGRKTFESIGFPLPNRRNIVLSRNKDYHPEGVEVIHSVEGLLEITEGEAEVMVIGGGHIYEQFMALAERLYVTEVELEVEGDTYFPMINMTEWKIIDLEFCEKDSPVYYGFLTYDRYSSVI
jgi:dihydrofolate reductase